MERVRAMIIRKISEKTANADYASLATGIDAYIRMNGLDVVASKMDDDGLNQYMNIYLEPFDAFSGEMLADFFCNYEKTDELKALSNSVFEIAKRKHSGEKVDCFATERIFNEITKLCSTLYRNSSLQQFLDDVVSECRLDLDYICEKSGNISIRLNEYING